MMNREEKLRRIGYLFGMAEERLLYFAYTYLEAGNRDYAEDAIQQAFEKILRKVDELDFTNEDDIRNYLYKTVKHICFNINRYFRKFCCNDTQEERDIVMELMLVQEAEGDFVVCANELVKLISGLQKNYATALLLSGVHGLSTAQIAKKMGITETTARQYLTRARKQMKKKYKLDDWS